MCIAISSPQGVQGACSSGFSLFVFSKPLLKRALIFLSLLASLILASVDSFAGSQTPAAMPSVAAGDINSSDQVGTTPGAFMVDKSGAATYSMSLFAVPGTAGTTPKLALKYSSEGGNGLIGQGWKIDGLSEITRCRPNRLQDGVDQPIAWSANDKYCIDGERLIYVGYGVVYKREVDNGDIIIAYGGVAGAPEYFRVQHKDGSFTFYGNAPTTRDPNGTTLANTSALQGKTIANGDSTKVLSWKIRKYQDAAGNPIWYQHGWYYGFGLMEVRYAYGTNAGPDGYGARIYFSYTGRPDPFDIGYIGGLAGLGNGWRLSQITSENGGTPVRTYNLSYLEQSGDAYTGPSHLSSIQECGLNNVCLTNSTQFTWAANPIGFNTTPAFNGTVGATPVSAGGITTWNNTYYFTDLNKDGCADIIYQSPQGYGTQNSDNTFNYYYMLGNCSTPSANPQQISFSQGVFTNGSTQLRSLGRVWSTVIDYNGDGHVDFITADYNNLYIYLSAPQSDGSWKLSSTPITIAGNFTNGNNPYLLDINGDGLVDFVQTTSNGLTVNPAIVNTQQPLSSPNYYQYGTAVSPSTSCLPSTTNGVRQWSFTDNLSGNALPGVMVTGAGSNEISAQVFNGLNQLTCYASLLHASPYGMHYFTDINGDGIADFIDFEPTNPSTSFYNISSGTALLNAKTDNTVQPGGPANTYRVGPAKDFNSDGYFDYYDQNWNLTIWNPSTQSFQIKQQVSAPPFVIPGLQDYNANTTGVYDFNGDGIPDLYQVTSNQLTIYFGLGSNQPRNMITQITNGLGAVTKINYENTQTSTHYSKLSVGTPPSNFPQTLQWGSKPYVMPTVADYYTSMNSGFDPGVYLQQSLGKQAPVFDLNGPMWVVASVDQSLPATSATSTTLGSVNTAALHRTSFYYGEGKIEGSVRGFLGFHTIKVVDEATGLQTVTRYRQDFPFIGKPVIVDVYTGSNQHVSSTWNWWAFQNWGNGQGTPPYLATPEPAIVFAQTFNPDVAGNPRVGYTWTANTFDANLNKVSAQIDTKDSSDNVMATVLVTNTYPTDNRGWLGLPSQVTVKSSRPNQPDLVRNYAFTYLCYDSSPCPYSSSYNPLSGLLYQKIVEPSKPAYNVTTQYSYDAMGNPAQAVVSGTNFVNHTTSWAYDTSSTTPLGRFQDQTTNGLNQLVSNVVSRNALGQPMQINGLNNQSVQFAYGPLGRQYLEYYDDGSSAVTLRHTSDVNCPTGTTIADYTAYAGGNSLLECFDRVGRAIRVSPLSFGSGAMGRWVDTEYDPAGRIHNKTEPYYSNASPGGFTTTTYDNVGRLSSVKVPDGGNTTITYNGLTKTTTNPAGQVKIEANDLMGELSSVTDNLSGIIQYSYDAEGHPLTVTTSGPNRATGVPASIAVTYTYDDVGRKKSMTDPDKGTWNYTYDALGELLTQTDAKNQAISIPAPTNALTPLGYDALGRVLKRIDKKADGSVEQTTLWAYDTVTNGVGEVANIQQQDSGSNTLYTRVYAYDSLGRETAQAVSYPVEGMLYDITQFFDQYGRVYQTYDASGNGFQTNYNNQGYAWQFMDLSSTGVVGNELYAILTMDGSNRITSDRLGGQVTVGGTTRALIGRTLGYDVLGRPKAIQSVSGATLQNLSYSYYGVGNNQYGNLSQRQDLTKGLTETFAYDGLNRLTSSQVSGQSAVTVSYDSFGNIINKSDQGTYSYGNNAGPHAVTQISGVAGNLSYDANGNNTLSPTSTGTRFLSYNTFDKPISLLRTTNNTLTQFTYGPDRDYYKRVDNNNGVVTKTLYLVGVEKVFKPDGTRDDRRYLPGGAYSINTYNSSGALVSTSTEYLLDDHLGSTDVIADSNGAVKQAMSFNAWGMRRNPGTWVPLTTARGFDNSQTSHGYTGHEMVDNFDIVHMHGRIYDARWGRMLQADPYIQDGANTQAQNRFAYVNNNPLRYIDPTGYGTTDGWNMSQSDANMTYMILAGGGSVYGAGGEYTLSGSGAQIASVGITMPGVSGSQSVGVTGASGVGSVAALATPAGMDIETVIVTAQKLESGISVTLPGLATPASPTATGARVGHAGEAGIGSDEALVFATREHLGSCGSSGVCFLPPKTDEVVIYGDRSADLYGERTGYISRFGLAMTGQMLKDLGYFRDGVNLSTFFIGGGEVAAGFRAFKGAINGAKEALAGGIENIAAKGAGELSRAAEFGIKPYNQLIKDLKGTGLQAHHLIEQRFSSVFGQSAREGLSVGVTPAEHQAFTNAWRSAIPYGEGTANATQQQVMDAARQIYSSHPEILNAMGL